MREFITILTPTYNRLSTLKRLFRSLCEQTNKNFVWMILDDGSDDGTQDFVGSIINEKTFKIEYFYNNNVGKHKIINMFDNKLKTDLVIIVDSDDTLLAEAISIVYYYWQKFNSKYIAGLAFHKANIDSKFIIGDVFPPQQKITSHENMRIIIGVKGDKAEVWLSQQFKSIHFQEFENEKFISEIHKYIQLSGDRPFVYINEIIYLCEYSKDGLSKNIRKLQFSNPKGALFNSSILLNKNYPLLVRFKALVQSIYFIYLIRNYKRLPNMFLNYPLMFLAALPVAFLYCFAIKLKELSDE